MTSIRTAIRHLDALALLALAAWGVSVAYAPADLGDLVGTCTVEVAQVVGSPCWAPEAPIIDPTDALADAATVATLTDGMTCDTPTAMTAAGIIPTAVAVRSVDTGTISVVDLGTALDAATLGTVTVLTACTA